jgi:DNA polymerase III epsilon subunit-like protein
MNMTKLIFFDTETTGNTASDFLCQIAYKCGDEVFSGLYKPEKRIPPEASAVHHITNKMVENKLSFAKSDDSNKIKKLFEHEDSIVVAHNAPFDLMMIAKEGIMPNKFICTLRVARELDKDGKIDRYNLQYLRYLLEIEVDAIAHDAMGDVYVLEQLFKRLLAKIMEVDGASEEEAIHKMVDISSHPSLLRTFHFGKYNGRKVSEVAQTDRDYLRWLLEQKLESEQVDEDWIYTLKYYLEK